jgi:DNA polymerase III delta prime subunit
VRAPQRESNISFLNAIRAATRASQFATQLRGRFARQPKSKAFVGWQSYYRVFLEEAASRPLIDLRGPHVGDERRQQEIIDSIAAGAKVFLVSAPPGCGKSRFALELARRLGRTQSSWDVRFVRHDEPAFRQELHELTRAKRVVLIVDDAHHCPVLVEQLAAFCAAPNPASQVHLVCLTQPTGRAVLAQALASHFSVGVPLDIDLGRPNAKLMRELIDKLIPQLSPHHRDVIRRFVGDSFFATVLLCTSVARQKSLPQTLSIRNLRDYAIRQPVAQAIGDLCPVEKAFHALAVYAACAPVRTADAVIRACAAALSGLSAAAIETLEQRVTDANLFQRDATQSLRPVPDLVGDLILEETCLNEQGRPTPFGQSLIRALFEQGLYEPVIRNCGDIARLFSSPVRVEFLSELVLDRATHLSAQTQTETFELLASCSGLAARQPAAIVRLVEVLTAKGALRAEPPAREVRQPDNPEARAQSLLATASEHDTTIVVRALEYSRGLLARCAADSDSYRFLHDELLTSCRFGVARSLAHAAAVLDVLTGWVAGSDLTAAELAASVVHGFLQLEMHAPRLNQDAPVSVSLDPSDEVWKLRDRALDLLVRCARHAAPAVQYAAGDSLEYWAHGYINLTAELRERWAPQLNRELESLVATFGQLGSTTTHLPVRAVVEHQGWRWWLDGPDPVFQRGGKRLLEALSVDSLPAANLYPLWKALTDPTLPVLPVALDESIEPQDRRKRLLALIEPSAERAAELARELFDRLDPAYDGVSAWSTAFICVLTALPKRPLQPGAHLFLAEFVRRHPAEAWSFITEASAQGALGDLLPTLLAQLRGQDPGRWHEAIQRAQPGTRLFEVELGALCAASELDPVERALVSKGLQLDDAESVHLAARALLSATQSELGPGLAAVFAVLPRRPTDERLWDLALDAFARWAKHVLSVPAEEETGSEVRSSAGELLRLLRTYGNSISWQEGPHTGHLTTVVAIFAVAIPHTLKSWMRELWSGAVDHADDELALSPDRMEEVVRLIASSPTASYWQKQFMEWITEEPSLAAVGGRGLAGLCGLTDPAVAPLVTRIAREPTTAALEGLSEFLRTRASSPRFVDDAQILLGELAAVPEAHELLQKEVMAVQAAMEESLLRVS